MNFQPVKDFMDRLTNWVIPGNTIMIYKDGVKVFEYSSGFSDIENNVEIQGDELLNFYSCSKPATAAAALQLYEKGMFLLTDPLCEYLPEFKTMYVKNGDEIKKADNKITIRDVFCMTAGLTYDLNSPSINKAREITNGKMDTRTVVKCLSEEPLIFEPGTKWNYSLCHDILAVLVEVVSDMRFSEYMNENIFKPLDMKTTYYHTDKPIAPQYVCTSLDTNDYIEMQKSVHGTGAVKREDGNVFVFGEKYDSGGAGIISTVPDYVKFVAALANKGTGLNGNKILSPGTIELMKTNQLNKEQLKYFNWSQLIGYGYGLGVRTMIDRAASGSAGPIGEFGWGGAAGASMFADTENNFAVLYSHHMLNPQETYYQPRLRNVLYSCL